MLDKLDALLAQTSTSKQDAALLADLLSLSNDGRYPAVDVAPQPCRQKTLDALGLQLEILSRSSPVLMIFEDAHWTDPTSLEVFSRTVNRIATLRVLLIVTFRPEFEPALGWRAVRDSSHPQSARTPRNHGHDRPHDRQQPTSGEHKARYSRSNRWHSFVRGGDDEGCS
jgi:hypothetical protein